MDTFLSTVRSRQRSLVLQKCRAEIPHRRRNKCGETGERNKLISYPVSVFALSISIQVQGIAYRKSLKCVIMCCLLLRLGKIFSYELLEQQWISECQLGFLRKPVSQCVQKTVRGANSSLGVMGVRVHWLFLLLLGMIQETKISVSGLQQRGSFQPKPVQWVSGIPFWSCRYPFG